MTQVYLAVMAVEGGRYVDLVGYLVMLLFCCWCSSSGVAGVVRGVDATDFGACDLRFAGFHHESNSPPSLSC